VAVAVTVVGVEALQADMARATRAGGPLDRAMAAAGVESVAPVATAARAAVPHETGRLAAAITVTGSRSGASVRYQGVVYAGPVDFGGYPGDRPYIPSGRYLFPAAAQLGPTAQARFSAAVGAALGRYGWTNTGPDAHD
jgi:hypothetical protein